MLGKNEGQMRKGQQRISGLYSITDSLGRGDFPDSSVGKEFSCNARDSSSITESGRSTGEGIGYPLQHSWASLVAGKDSPCNVGDLGSVPELGRSPGEGKSYLLQ